MKIFNLIFLVVFFSPVRGQVIGKVLDAVTEMPVHRALVISGDSAVFTEAGGAFNICLSDWITVDAPGYERLSFMPDMNKPLLIRLQPLIYDLSEVSVTAYHTQGKLRLSSGALSVIPVDAYHRAGYNIVSALSYSPGAFIQEASPGTMKLTLRGIGSRYPYGTKKIKMFFNDIPLYSAEGETYFDDISPEYISRLEILRGPASGIYGSSLGGAVVLYPKRPEFGRSEIGLMSSAGSFGYRKNSLSFSSGHRKDDILVSLSQVKSDGYRENSKYIRNSFMINYNRNMGEKLKGSLLISGSNVRAQIPSSIDSATFHDNPQRAAPHWLLTGGNKSPDRLMAGYKMTYNPLRNLEIISSVFTAFRENEENRPFNFLNESGLSYGGRILARYAGNTGSVNYRLTAGTNQFLEIYRSSISENIGGQGVKGNTLQGGRQNIYQSDFFIQGEVKLSAFKITGGININNSGFRFADQFSSDSMDQSGYYNFKPVFSPRLSLAWNPEKNINMYIAFNHGFTIPSLSETQTPLGLINTDIKPEKAWSYETGVRFNLLQKSTFIDLALYYMIVSDLIVPKRVEEDFYVGMNAGASLHRGIEIAINQWLWGRREQEDANSFSALMNLSYSLNRFHFLDFVEDETNFSGNQLPGMPQHIFSGKIDITTRTGVFSMVEINTSGRIPLDDYNKRFSDAHTVLNSGVGYEIPLKNKWKINVLLQANNIANVHYASMVVVNATGTAERPPRIYYPGMPRWFSFHIAAGYSSGKGRE